MNRQQAASWNTEVHALVIQAFIVDLSHSHLIHFWLMARSGPIVLPQLPELEVSTELSVIFEQAKTEFLQSLTPEEQLQFSTCTSAEGLLVEVKQFEVVLKSKQRGLRYAQKVKTLADNLEPYFKIIGIMCSAHPDIQRVSLALPRYEDVFQAVESAASKDFVTQRLRDSMSMFYSDLFEFFQTVARVFSDRKGMKEELHWATLGELRTTLRSAAQRNENDAQSIRGIRAATTVMAKKVEKEHMDAFCSSVIKWLNPPEYVSPFEQAQDARENGTAEWLMKNNKYQEWGGETPLGPILWIQGNPGWGKTVLAASVIEELRDDQSDPSLPPPIICYYFFCQRGVEKAVRHQAYRALATQLFQQCKNLEEIYNIYNVARAVDDLQASEHELIDLLRLALAQLANVVFVLDGIDECVDNARLAQELCQFTATSKLKIIFFSRPNVSCLRRTIKDECTVRMSREISDKDITIFLDSELQLLKDGSLLPSDSDISAFREIILERADGMFLWARLLIVYLNSAALSRTERVHEITRSTPEGLDVMYNRIFNHIKSLDRASRQLASRIFMWVAYAKSSMAPVHLKEVVWGSNPNSTGGDQVEDFEHAIIVSCCGLIEKRQNTYLYFVHLTAQEFILSPRLCSDMGLSFVLSENQAASEIVESCLSYLVTAVPPRPLGGDIHMSTSASHLRTQYPFLAYATIQWAQHLKDAFKFSATRLDIGLYRSRSLATALKKLLEAKANLMVWVEALYTYREASIVETIRDAIDLMETRLAFRSSKEYDLSLSKVLKDMKDLVDALKNVHTQWGETLLIRPHEIWNDLTVFTPNKFFLQTSAATVRTFQPQPAIRQNTQEVLFKISSNSPDGRLVGTISIRPSRAFAEYWTIPKKDTSTFGPNIYCGKAPSKNSTSELLDLAEGWTASYEIFSLDNQVIPQRSAQIPLSGSEIAILLRQSLRRSVLHHHRLAFPMIISNDLSSIIMLRTLFRFDGDRLGNNMDYNSQVFTLSSPNWMTPSLSVPPLEFTYSYEWLLSADCRFAVFQGPDRSLAKRHEPIVLFRITNKADSGIQLREVKSLRIFADCFSIHIPLAIHPEESRLIFVTSKTVWVTDLEIESEPMKVIDLTSIMGEIKCIGFSACGDYFTITYHGVKWPEVYPYQRTQNPKQLASSALPIRTSIQDLSSKKRSSDQLDASTESTLCTAMRTAKMPKLVNTSSLIMSHPTGNKIQTQIQVSHEIRPQSIQLATQAQDLTTRTLSIARVPQSVDLRYTNTTVLWPGAQQGSMQIILNAAAKPSYDSDENHISPYLPAVLTRNLNSLAAPHQGYAKAIQEGYGTYDSEGAENSDSYPTSALELLHPDVNHSAYDPTVTAWPLDILRR
ncbi:hypothetical protein VTL71DRAFT_4688 [Oculimacula yallundae]|uniref:NACHT domain-containing protein n=1 Tax=Oculimacula yallundae TaxID=86028 RepID=A0ABR4C2S3_9HELO